MVTRRNVLRGSLGMAGAVLLGVAAPLEAQAAVSSAPQRGSTGSRVVTLQNRLNQLGYWCGAADGSFGWMTYHAVVACQKAANIARDGSVGPITAGKLNEGYRPRALYNGGDTHFEVDKKRQILLTVTSGVVKEIASTSTGNGERYYQNGWHYATTPSGSFKIYSRYSSGWQPGPPRSPLPPHLLQRRHRSPRLEFGAALSGLPRLLPSDAGLHGSPVGSGKRAHRAESLCVLRLAWVRLRPSGSSVSLL